MNGFFLGNLEDLTKKPAYEYWERRGSPWGSPEVDWFAAEKTLASSRGNSQEDFSLLSVRVEPVEGPLANDHNLGSAAPFAKTHEISNRV